MTSQCTQVLVLLMVTGCQGALQSSITPYQVSVFVGRSQNFTIFSNVELKQDAELTFESQEFVQITHPLRLNASIQQGVLELKGTQPTKKVLLKPASCQPQNKEDCDALLKDFYLEVVVLKSSFVAALVMIVGWAYFTAWSVSFYPQILLNIERKSVVGLNFDFLTFNILGFSAYSIYNLFLFLDPNVQAQYEAAHPHSPIPVLLNDVFFAVHALIISIITAAQCLFYERGSQRVSFICMAITSVLLLSAFGAGIATFIGFLNMLQFVTGLSYIKMAATLFKYIPQAIHNYKRKSTVGWSIGNILLDFTGGSMDIMQMCLQSWNVSNWSAFYGNPVKFGLGLVSTLFDILFMTQHYILYPRKHPTARATDKSDRFEMGDSSATEKLTENENRSRTQMSSSRLTNDS